MTKLIEDVSTLTSIPENLLKKLVKVSNYCVGHALHEALCEQQDYVTVDIGIGDLQLKLQDNTLRYKFIPSRELEDALVTTVKSGTSSIIVQLDNTLQEKIEDTYRGLL